MAYVETAVLHEGGYVPPSPAVVYETRNRPVGNGSTTEITIFGHDDTDPVPAGGAQEIERWAVNVSADQQNKIGIRQQAEAAMAQLATIRDAASLDNTQAVDAIQYQAQVLRRLVRLTVGLYDGTD